jgi:polyhydroxyalkanoate synthesis regulator phasin
LAGDALMYVDQIRALVEDHMTPGAPLAQALTATADALDAQIRGLEAAIERIETLEERVDDLSAHNTTAIDPEIL